jgi:hypothetical protein
MLMAFVTFDELPVDTIAYGIVSECFCFGPDFRRDLLVRNITTKGAKANRAKRSQSTTSTPITLSQNVAPVKGIDRVKWMIDFSFR